MSDFMNEGWSNYITLVSLVGIIWCIWLLFSQRKAKVIHTAEGTVSDTGHVWDGDLRELNNPLPNWWRWMYLIGCLFGLTYLALYPGLGSYSGLLDFTTSKELTTSMEQANQELKPIYAKYSNMSIEQVAVDPKAQEIGQRLFLNSCSQCHGSDAGGSTGFPNLTDADWLYGGKPQDIQATITLGRNGVMPPFAAIADQQVDDVANYTRSLSSLPNDTKKSERGAAVFKTYCVACHGNDGKGNMALGAPNLTDKVWLYGGSQEKIIETIIKGRMAMMPAQDKVLSVEKIKLLTAYVWGLSNNKATSDK